MGTRSVVAIPDAQHGWKGRYVHWDGYPTGVGETLRRLLNREGPAVAMDHLVRRHYGWSSLDERESGPLSVGYQDGRFATVIGFGVAYTTERGQSSPDEWVTADGDDWNTEWAYVVQEGAIQVFVNHWSANGSTWREVGVVSLDDPDGMARVEKTVYAAS